MVLYSQIAQVGKTCKAIPIQPDLILLPNITESGLPMEHDSDYSNEPSATLSVNHLIIVSIAVFSGVDYPMLPDGCYAD